MELTGTTKEKIVELGRRYAQQLGYNSMHYSQIADALMIKRAAIHSYFPGKEDLGIAIIQKDKSDFLTMRERFAKSTPTKKIDALLKNYQQYFADGNKLCVIGTFGSAYTDIPEKIKAEAADYLNLIADWLTDVLQEGLDSGEFNFEGSPEEMANLWIATLPGTLQIGRIKGEVYFKKIQKSLKKGLKTK
ncbi:MAG TPA: TetR/AcrR family transcriptional regulator [Chryseolinea sp.]